MAADFIPIVKANRPQLGNQIITSANTLVQERQLIAQLNANAQHMFTGADYSVFEAQFGITAGQGANTLNLLGLINTILNTNTDVLGASRFSQLDEFCARLSGQ